MRRRRAGAAAAFDTLVGAAHADAGVQYAWKSMMAGRTAARPPLRTWGGVVAALLRAQMGALVVRP